MRHKCLIMSHNCDFIHTEMPQKEAQVPLYEAQVLVYEAQVPLYELFMQYIFLSGVVFTSFFGFFCQNIFGVRHSCKFC